MTTKPKLPLRARLHPWRTIRALSRDLKATKSQNFRLIGQIHALHDKYAEGLAQGRADAYYGNLPPCPECGNHMPFADTHHHKPRCTYGRRG